MTATWPLPDSTLLARLRETGARFDAAALRDLVAGIAAAPLNPADPDGWLRLIATDPPPALAASLRAYRETLAAHAEGGLGAGKTETPMRLADLREELARRGLDGVLVPRADAHQGEFVPPHAQRLAWLSGFTGSAGLAAVLSDRAALFVDGRYTLQAAQELDTDLIAPINLGETRPRDWLAEALPAGARLGYDPWLHTPDDLSALTRGLALSGVALVAESDNPVDAVWPGRPPPPIAPVVPHPLRYTGREAEDKRGEVAEALAREGVESAVLTLPDSIAWLLNVRGGDIPHTPVALSFAVVHRDASVNWFVDARKLTPAARDALGAGVYLRPPGDFRAALLALGHGGQAVLLDPQSAPAVIAADIAGVGGTVRHGPDPVQALKARKTAVELDGARAAQRRDGAAVARFLAWLSEEATRRATTKSPVSEMEAARTLAGLRAADPMFRDLSFETIAGAGPNGAIVHYRVDEASNRGLDLGELFLCDSGGQYLDGTTDITRTVAIGPPAQALCARYTRVLKGHLALAMARFPEGTTGSQIDALARKPLWEVGLDYDHGTGHGVGSYLGVHEGPQRISKRPSSVALAPGMICSNEPGYYAAGAYGIRIETLVAVVDPGDGLGDDDGRRMLGFETLTLAPYCRALIDRALLTPAEEAWIDAYHARVYESLAPLLDAASRTWLAAETAALGRG